MKNYMCLAYYEKLYVFGGKCADYIYYYCEVTTPLKKKKKKMAGKFDKKSENHVKKK